MTLPRMLKDPSPTREKPVRSPAHRAWVRRHGCCVPCCNGTPIEAAHVRDGLPYGAERGGTGSKPGDMWVISLCKTHHATQTHYGETWFQKEYGIDMKALAQEFAAKSPHRMKLRRQG